MNAPPVQNKIIPHMRNDNVPPSVFCQTCMVNVHGRDVRWLRRQGPSGWVTLEVTYYPLMDSFSCFLAHYDDDSPQNQNMLRRFFDLRVTPLDKDLKMFWLNWTRYGPTNQRNGMETRWGLEVVNWHIIMQDILTPQMQNFLNVRFFPGPDRPNERPHLVTHEFECCLNEQILNGVSHYNLTFQRPGGQWCTPEPRPLESSRQHRRYNRCPYHMLAPQGPAFQHQRSFHTGNANLLTMKYGLERAMTPWVDVIIDQVLTPAGRVDRSMMVVRRILGHRGTDNDWNELQACPMIPRVDFFHVQWNAVPKRWQTGYGIYKCVDYTGNPQSSLDGFKTVAVGLVQTPNGQTQNANHTSHISNAYVRSVRRIWDPLAQRFALAFEVRHHAI